VFFKQGGMEIPMTLTRQNETIKPLNRPQTPKAPLITLPKKLVFKTSLIKNTLAGTLSIPKNFIKNSILVMITGSGSQNRDEETFEHKPLL
jgi:hypothetical protein